MKYLTNGFNLLNCLAGVGLLNMPAAAVSITKGQALFDDGSGYVTNVGTAFAATFVGIAAANVDNSAGDAGDLNAFVISPDMNYRFKVKNESVTVIAQTDVGEIVDLESNDGVDVTDTTTTSWGFRIDKIDISAGALAANAGGFAIGRFVKQND